jgi:dUTP pyrophosphatase
MNEIKVKLLHPDSKLPTKASPTDVGFDVYAHSFDEINGALVIKLGISVEPPDGYYLELVPRSSLSKEPWVQANSVGIIDPSYRGEVQMRLRRVDHIDSMEHNFKQGDRVAQLILRKNEGYNFQITQAETLSDTERGTGGFGSTGK